MCASTVAMYRIRQNIRGGKLSRIFAKRECFTIENFPS